MGLKQIENMFPLQYRDNQILYLDKIIGRNNKDWNLIIYDNEGYKYKTTNHRLSNSSKIHCELNRFFKRNPFTYYNINNYCKINEIDLHIDGTELPISGLSREKLNFIDSNKNKYNLSWNELQVHPERYRKDYYEILCNKRNINKISKEEVVKIIYDMQSKLDRPIDSRDFRVKQEGCIGIRTIIKYWGEVWLMQKELGLTITGKHSSILSSDECLNEIKTLCNTVYEEENRKVITIDDFRKYATYSDARPYREACNKTGETLKTYIEHLGFALQDAGTGFNYIYDDTERVVSMHEYKFSNFLRSIGLAYNKDYFRDIKYKTLTSEYKGNMNCDYEIHFQGRIFYIELAGMLGNKVHDKCYRNNIPIQSKSKEKYRLGLIKKKEIFERENLEYYILLPSDMTEENYKKILYKINQEVA